MNKLLQSIKTPQESVNDDTVIINEILFKTGDKVNNDDILAVIETSKALVDIVCEETGYLNCLCEIGQEVKIGETLFEIFSEEVNINKSAKVSQNKKLESKINTNADILSVDVKLKFSKEAEKLMKKNKIDKKLFKGLEFITTDDINKVLDYDSEFSRNTVEEKLINSNKSDLIKDGLQIEKQKLNEIKYLSSVNSVGLVSRLTTFISADIDSIAKSQNFISTTPLPLIVYEVSRLLIKYPNLNTFFHNNNLIPHKSINIGVAFDNGINGLKVASMEETEAKNLIEIEENISELAIKYNNNDLSIKELNSTTFTITDLFSTGISNFHPLINYENSAILGICGLNKNGFNIEISFDHRVTNGLEVSKFLNDLKFRLESRYMTNNNHFDERSKKISCIKCLRDINEETNLDIKFIRVQSHKENGYICSLCFSGW